ncbi:hypothetical protein ACFQNF_15835 [Iodobacter arcticus]|uniref:Uncharacterized protein n=1 Tax=Iodobacter arcticus TaxID=590593 RepID=A0ABW2R5K3_9NEIS
MDYKAQRYNIMQTVKVYNFRVSNINTDERLEAKGKATREMIESHPNEWEIIEDTEETIDINLLNKNGRYHNNK